MNFFKMQIYDLYHWSLILGSCVQICILNMRPKNSDEQSHFENTVLAEEKKSNIFFFFVSVRGEFCILS